VADKHRDSNKPALLHEALDRTSVISTMIDVTLVEHAGVQSVPAAAKKIQKAALLLGEAYQIIGATAEPYMAPVVRVKRRAKANTRK
jgi:hypothetical protein